MTARKTESDKNTFSDKPKLAALRDGFSEGILKLGEENKNVVLLCADVAESTHSHFFKEKFPERFFEMGVAEQNMAAVAAGFALAGKIPFISSYAVFSPGRNFEQIRTTICYSNLNVKIAGHHSGLSAGPDGATHQALEDITMMRALPEMKVFVPCDALEAKKAVIASAKIHGPVYIRLARERTPLITSEKTPFIPGRADIIFEPKEKIKPQVLIIGAGPVLYEALLAAAVLEKEKIGAIILNLHTIKPLDENKIIELAKKTGCVVSIEEHQIFGGVGGAVSELLSKKYPIPMEFVGVKDSFGKSGLYSDLIKKYNLDSASIIESVMKVIKRKKF